MMGKIHKYLQIIVTDFLLVALVHSGPRLGQAGPLQSPAQTMGFQGAKILGPLTSGLFRRCQPCPELVGLFGTH